MWRVTADLDEYLVAAGAFVAARPVDNSTLLSVAETLRTRGLAAFGGPAPLFGWWDSGGDVAGAFVHTPPYPLLPTALSEPAVPALAAALAGRPLSGVNGAAPVARAFADAWGADTTVRRQEWLYRLETLSPPRAVAPGRMVAATAERRELLVAWMAQFLGEIDEPADAAGRQVDNRLQLGGLWLWEVDDTPTALAGASPRLAGAVRIGPVYTPPAHRGGGYAGALTAEVSRAALADGAGTVLLYVDAANQTSTRLYLRLGFRPVEERLVLAFDD